MGLLLESGERVAFIHFFSFIYKHQMSTYYEQEAVVSARVRTQLIYCPYPQRMYILVGKQFCK